MRFEKTETEPVFIPTEIAAVSSPANAGDPVTTSPSMARCPAFASLSRGVQPTFVLALLLFPQCRDVCGEVARFKARERHVRHLGVRVEEEDG